jgi:hypothetical protein
MKTVLKLLMLAPLLAYALSANDQLSLSAAQSPALAKVPKAVRTVPFCELVKHPSAYFDKAVRVTALYRMGVEGAALWDKQCPSGADDVIGIGFVHTDDEEYSEALILFLE